MRRAAVPASSSPRRPRSTTSRSRALAARHLRAHRAAVESERRHEEQDADRGALRVHHADEVEGVPDRHPDDAGLHGDRVRRAEIHAQRHRHQGSALRRRRSDRRPLRPLAAAAEEWNRRAATGVQTQPRFLPTPATFDEQDQQARAQLSDRVRKNELYAFVEIPPTRSIRR